MKALLLCLFFASSANAALETGSPASAGLDARKLPLLSAFLNDQPAPAPSPDAAPEIRELAESLRRVQEGTDGTPAALTAQRAEIGRLALALAVDPGRPQFPKEPVYRAYLSRRKGQTRPPPGAAGGPKDETALAVQRSADVQKKLAGAKGMFGPDRADEGLPAVTAGTALAPTASTPLEADDFKAQLPASFSLKAAPPPAPAKEPRGQAPSGANEEKGAIRSALDDGHQTYLDDLKLVQSGLQSYQQKMAADCASYASLSCAGNLATQGYGYLKASLDVMGMEMTGEHPVKGTAKVVYDLTPIGGLQKGVSGVIEDPGSKGNWGMLALSFLPMKGAATTLKEGITAVQAGERVMAVAPRASRELVTESLDLKKHITVAETAGEDMGAVARDHLILAADQTNDHANNVIAAQLSGGNGSH